MENENGSGASEAEKTEKIVSMVCIKKKQVYIYSPSASNCVGNSAIAQR
jgi:hypothetical protein